MNITKKLVTKHKQHQHIMKSHNHRGNVVNFRLANSTPYFTVYKCSFCHATLEVRK